MEAIVSSRFFYFYRWLVAAKYMISMVEPGGVDFVFNLKKSNKRDFKEIKKGVWQSADGHDRWDLRVWFLGNYRSRTDIPFEENEMARKWGVAG